MINRSEVLNPLDFQTLREMSRAFEDASWDDAIGVLVLTWGWVNRVVETRSVDVAAIREELAIGGSTEFQWGPYTRACPACGASPLPEAFVFCGRCGHRLEDDA